MRKHIFVLATSFLVMGNSMVADTVSWLPEEVGSAKSKIRLLECIYDKAQLERCEEITPSSSDWEVVLNGDADGHTSPHGTEYVYEYTFKAKRDLKSAGVAVAFDRYNWSSDNYVMIPSVVYNGNRQRIVNRPYATGLDATDYRSRYPSCRLSSVRHLNWKSW